MGTHTMSIRFGLKTGCDTCTVCGSNMDCFHLNYGGKISCFNCHRHWLPQNHKFRQQKNTFKKDNIVTNRPLNRLSGPQIANMLDKLTPDPKRPGYFEGYGGMHIWTNKCGLWELSYMLVLILMQNIDVIHQEDNMHESIKPTWMCLLGKTKDNIKAQNDLADLCKTGGKPHASFCLKRR
jgi:hypothetical protein